MPNIWCFTLTADSGFISDSFILVEYIMEKPFPKGANVYAATTLNDIKIVPTISKLPNPGDREIYSSEAIAFIQRFTVWNPDGSESDWQDTTQANVLFIDNCARLEFALGVKFARARAILTVIQMN